MIPKNLLTLHDSFFIGHIFTKQLTELNLTGKWQPSESFPSTCVFFFTQSSNQFSISIAAIFFNVIFTLAIFLGFISAFLSTAPRFRCIHCFGSYWLDFRCIAQMSFNLLPGVISWFWCRLSPATCSAPACNDDAELCPGRIICEPVSMSVFSTIDDVTIYIFTFEYCVKLLTCWSVSAA